MSEFSVKTTLHVYDGRPETLPPKDAQYYYYGESKAEFVLASYLGPSKVYTGDPFWTWDGEFAWAQPGDIWAEIPLPPDELAYDLLAKFEEENDE
jgi:hypothetical protein